MGLTWRSPTDLLITRSPTDSLVTPCHQRESDQEHDSGSERDIASAQACKQACVTRAHRIVCCSVLQCIAVCCSVLQYAARAATHMRTHQRKNPGEPPGNSSRYIGLVSYYVSYFLIM